MKRLIVLMLALLLTVPALAWEVSDAMIDFAAQVAPGYTLLDGFLFDDTAMLLLKDAQGQTCFAGCVREEDAWTITLSTPIPEGTFAAISYASSDTAVLNLNHPSLYLQRNPDENTDCNYTIRLQEGSWLIQEADDLIFEEGYVWTESGSVCYGEILFSLDIAEVDWLTFPLTVEEAAAQMDVSDWAILSSEAMLYSSPDGQPFAWYYPGTSLLILDRRSGWYEVAILGGRVSGWIEAEHLIIGEAQAEAIRLTLEDLPLLRLGRHKEVIPVLMHPDGPTLTTLNGSRDAIMYTLGTWFGNESWVHVYDRDLPGEEGFIREEDLVPLNENGPWG